MKKSLFLSTLLTAAALSVPAFADATLLGSWDFSTATAVETGSGTYTIASTTGNLSITTGSELNNGNLEVTTSSDSSHETTIDISSASVTAAEGVSIVITLTGWDFYDANSGNYIFASLKSSTVDNYAALGGTNPKGRSDELNGDGTMNTYMMASGSTSNMGNITGLPARTSGEIVFEQGVSTTLTLTFIGDILCIYQDGELLATGQIGSSYYKADDTITGVAIGSWDSSSTGNESGMTISSIEIWRGDVTTLPEPALFSLFFSVGALGLVATRRRRRR